MAIPTDDVYYVDSNQDIVIEPPNGGIDTVHASVTYKLPANVEHLVLLTPPLPSRGIDGTGNKLANKIEGNSGRNVLRGLDGNDTLLGNDGNDELDGGTGDDVMLGGDGNDTYIVDSSFDLVDEVGFDGVDTVLASVTFVLPTTDVEHLQLTGEASIDGSGNWLPNTITGNSGNNRLNGYAAADTMIGGAGDDTYVVSDAGDVVVELDGQGTDEVEAGLDHALPDHVENLTLLGAGNFNGTGNALGNTLSGNGSDNLLSGLDGDDTLKGWSGTDTLQGGNGSDTLEGGNGTDTLQGDTGSDTLHGGDEVDRLRGHDPSAGDDLVEDRYVFDSALGVAVGGVSPTQDWIDDPVFLPGSEGADDQILLDSSIFVIPGAALGALVDGVSYFEGWGLDGNGIAAAPGIYNNTATGELRYNPTAGVAGDSVVFAIVLTGVAGGSDILSGQELWLV